MKNKKLNEGKKHTKCICSKNIKFKNGMNYFKDFEYKCDLKDDKTSVSYEDGRFTTMNTEIFKNHFEII
jgi:translation initiation factor IF-3